MAFQQALGVRGRDPSSLLGDADGHDVVLLLINRFQDRGRRQQRNLVLAAAPAKQYTNPEFLHECILNPCLNSPTAKLTTRTCDSNGRAPGPPRSQENADLRTVAAPLCCILTTFHQFERPMRPPAELRQPAMVSLSSCAPPPAARS